MEEHSRFDKAIDRGSKMTIAVQCLKEDNTFFEVLLKW